MLPLVLKLQLPQLQKLLVQLTGAPLLNALVAIMMILARRSLSTLPSPESRASLLSLASRLVPLISCGKLSVVNAGTIIIT